MGVFQGVLASASFDREGDDRAIRFTVDVDDEAAALTGFLEQYQRIGIMYMDNTFGTGWDERLRLNLGDRVVASRSYPIGARIFEEQLGSLRGLDLDALVLLTTGAEGSLIARRAAELGITAQLVGTRPIETPDLIADPVAVDGLVYTYPSFNTSHPFVASYVTRYGRLPTVFAAEAYDAITTLAQAASQCGIDPTCIHAWYRGMSYDGALGHVEFDANGDAHYAFVLKQVRNGAFVEY
jgi:branched-chain amino acid transport system substrate-binding protein